MNNPCQQKISSTCIIIYNIIRNNINFASDGVHDYIPHYPCLLSCRDEYSQEGDGMSTPNRAGGRTPF